jgi:peptide/nickel transport system substrate-binding protein
MAFPKLALLLALAVGARAADDQVVVGQTFMAGAIDPTSGSTGWALTSHGISEKLFTVDKDGNIVGQVADSVERVSDNVWEVTLKDGYKFSDGTDVTAQAVADALTELNTVDPNGAGMASVGTMTVTAPSDGVVRIETERATHVMDAVLAEWVFTVYKKDGDEFVFTGPYAVDAFVGGGHIDLVPNMRDAESYLGLLDGVAGDAVSRAGTTSTARRAIARTSSSCSTPTASR